MNNVTEKRVAPSAERNKVPILNELRKLVGKGDKVLEIGSGTGQHACFFAGEMSQIVWQPTELPGELTQIRRWMADENSENILNPVEFDVTQADWPFRDFDLAYTCNTLHIMSGPAVQCLFDGVAGVLGNSGCLCAYGPFSFNGEHTAASNAEFDAMLRTGNPDQGVRDMVWLNELAEASGLQPANCTAMPSNNFFAVWERAT